MNKYKTLIKTISEMFLSRTFVFNMFLLNINFVYKKKRIMARAASRKSSGRVSRKVSAHRACVSKQAKRMHKTATRPRSHQLVLARANKACVKKRTHKPRTMKMRLFGGLLTSPGMDAARKRMCDNQRVMSVKKCYARNNLDEDGFNKWNE